MYIPYTLFLKVDQGKFIDFDITQSFIVKIKISKYTHRQQYIIKQSAFKYSRIYLQSMIHKFTYFNNCFRAFFL